MRRWYLVIGLVMLIAVHAGIFAQEPEASAERSEPASLSDNDPAPRFHPRFKGRALTLDINARVVEQDQTVIWDESHKKTTIPGHPVGIKLEGTNIVVVVQFTPYLRRGMQKFLVAQGQIWIEVPGQGIRYYTSMQTIPLEFGEPIYFFPLGSQTGEDSSRIEIMLTLYPYENEE